MRTFYVVFIIFIFFTGCATKEQSLLIQTLQSNASEYQAIGQTQNIITREDEKIIGFFTATYLHKKSLIVLNKQEKFIIGIYAQNDSCDWSVTLDGKSPLSINALEKDDEQLKKLPLLNEWSKYYLVTFLHNPKKLLTFKFKSEAIGNHTLKFSKVANYIHTKEAF